MVLYVLLKFEGFRSVKMQVVKINGLGRYFVEASGLEEVRNFPAQLSYDGEIPLKELCSG